MLTGKTNTKQLTQSDNSEIEHRSTVAEGVQDVILVLKHQAGAFRHHTDPIIFIIFYSTFAAFSINYSDNNRLWRKRDRSEWKLANDVEQLSVISFKSKDRNELSLAMCKSLP